MPQRRTERPVLVVEDHEDTREMVELFLKHDGFTVRTAIHGLDALKRVAHDPPCLILLDVTMPVMDGITFARKLRESDDRDLAAAPIILLTALPDADVNEALKETGALDVIHKPISFDKVLTVVGRHCHAAGSCE
jgi:CheY-like chemotaxis protein